MLTRAEDLCLGDQLVNDTFRVCLEDQLVTNKSSCVQNEFAARCNRINVVSLVTQRNVSFLHGPN